MWNNKDLTYVWKCNSSWNVVILKEGYIRDFGLEWLVYYFLRKHEPGYNLLVIILW